MLAHKPRDRAPVPEGLPRQEPPVRDRGVLMPNGRLGDVPALPAGPRRAVTEIDVLSVEAVTLVEAAQLVEHVAPQEEERGEHPVGLDRLGRPLVEQVVVPLPCLRMEERTEGSPPDDRAADRREAAARRLPAAVRELEPRPDPAGARIALGELEEEPH